jgi:catechol 2,3-dioxygenase-like lactoylglutathione lyase family enzyme
MVENQDTALHFYTTVLGFVKAKTCPLGPTFRWLTVTAPEGAEGVELLLEPCGNRINLVQPTV